MNTQLQHEKTSTRWRQMTRNKNWNRWIESEHTEWWNSMKCLWMKTIGFGKGELKKTQMDAFPFWLMEQKLSLVLIPFLELEKQKQQRWTYKFEIKIHFETFVSKTGQDLSVKLNAA